MITVLILPSHHAGTPISRRAESQRQLERIVSGRRPTHRKDES